MSDNIWGIDLSRWNGGTSQLLKLVCKYTGVTEAEVKGPQRGHRLAHIRNLIVIALAYNNQNYTKSCNVFDYKIPQDLGKSIFRLRQTKVKGMKEFLEMMKDWKLRHAFYDTDNRALMIRKSLEKTFLE